MSPFLSACQGIGLALAAGAIIGAVLRLAGPGAALAAVAGAVAFALSLSGNDHAAWPGIPAGAVVGALGFLVARGITAGATARAQASEQGGSAVAIAGTVALAAVAIAVLATLLPPISLALLVAFVWMAAGQRRRASRKYEGLRILR